MVNVMRACSGATPSSPVRIKEQQSMMAASAASHD